MKKAFLLLPILLLVGCDSIPTWDYAEVEGTVSQVRILQNGDTITRDTNHPVAGAVIGHALIGGAKGAIIGAAAGSGQVTTTHTEEVTACEIFITTHVNGESQERKFLFPKYSDLINKCALSLPGDKALVQYHYLHSKEHGTSEDFYSWECRYNDEITCRNTYTKEEKP